MSNSIRLHPPVRRDGPAVLRGPSTDVLGWLAAAGIGGSLLIMIAASVIRPDWMAPSLGMPSPGPPWQVHAHIPAGLVVIVLWLAVVMAVGGIVAGLLAARRGARGPVRLILVGSLLAVLVLALLPPVGSTDALDYAAYGRLTALGINPYVATPIYLRLTDPVFGVSIPTHWEHQVSLYGPAATIEQYLAARLGGNSMALVVLWLKIWNALAFGGVAFLLDRVLRPHPAQRLRAHLLWTANPLLIWGLIAGGHVDVLAAGAGLAGLLLAGRSGPGVRPVVWRALAGGALVGLAADIKIDYLLLGLGLAWALRRSVPALLAAAAGGLAILAPTYAWLGMPAFRALFARRDKTTQDSFYRFVAATDWKYLIVVAVVLFAAMTILLLRRLPAGDLGRPAIRPALALSVAWLFVWPYTLPWYDAMIICLLVLYPASRLDWFVLARLAVTTLANLPGDPSGVPASYLRSFDVVLVHAVAPAVMLAVVAGIVLTAVSGEWHVQPWPGGDPSALSPPVQPAAAEKTG